MKAKLLLHEKRLVAGGGSIGVAELKVWEVPRSRTCPEGRRFRLFLVVDGKVAVGFDNHQPKGAHLHLRGKEVPYTFMTLGQLVEDFWSLVRKEGFEP